MTTKRQLIYPAAIYYVEFPTQRAYGILDRDGDCHEIEATPDLLAKDLIERRIVPYLPADGKLIELPQHFFFSCSYRPPVEQIFLLHYTRDSSDADQYQVGRFTRQERTTFEEAVKQEMQKLLERSTRKRWLRRKLRSPPRHDTLSILRVLEGGKK